MKKIKALKTHILIAVYAVLLIVELFYYVPYNNIQIFRSKQNVPHTVIVGSGYATMAEIKNDKAYVDTKKSYWIPSEIGKQVNTSQLFMNVSITTILAVAIFLVLKQKRNKKVKEIPILDINALAFATEEEIVKAQEKYARQMAEYLK